MNIEQAKSYIEQAMNLIYSQYGHLAVYDDGCRKLMAMALKELESPVSTKKSNGYCSKCYWPEGQCQCFIVEEKPWPPWRKQGPGSILAEDMLVEVSPGPRSSGFARNVPDRVKVTHKPTGVSYSYSTERSQHANKQKARDKVMLELLSRGWIDKLYEQS